MNREYVDILNRMTAWELREFLKPDANGRRPTLPIGFENQRRRLAEIDALTSAEATATDERDRMRIDAERRWGRPEEWGPRPKKRRHALVVCLERPGETYTTDEAAAIAGVSLTGLYTRLNRGAVMIKGLTLAWADQVKGRVA